MIGSAAWRLALHEWRLILKEPRFLLPFLLGPLLILCIQAFAVFFHGAATQAEALSVARTLLLMLAVLTPSLAVPLGADSFAGERERNTLEILLCLPVRPLSLFWGKVMGILPLPMLIGWLSQGLLLGVLASRVPLSPETVAWAIQAMGLTPVLGLFFCALSTLVSLGAETVRGAAQLSSLAMIGIYLAVLSFSGFLFRSQAIYAACLATLLAGSALCLVLARRRFLRLP